MRLWDTGVSLQLRVGSTTGRPLRKAFAGILRGFILSVLFCFGKTLKVRREKRFKREQGDDGIAPCKT